MTRQCAVEVLLCLVLSLSQSTTAWAAFSLTFNPSMPHASDIVVATLANDSGNACLPPVGQLDVVGTTINYGLGFSDSCAPENIVVRRDYSLGIFPAAAYLVVVQACHDEPPPLPSGCDVLVQAPLVVTAEPDISTVPGTLLASLALGAGMLLAAVFMVRKQIMFSD